MRIEVENLTPTGEPFSNIYGPGQLALEDDRLRLTGETKVEGRATRKGDEVRLRGNIQVQAEAVCDRCLKTVPLPLEVEFDTAFLPAAAEAGKAENVELLPDELGLAAYEGDAIDLDDLVREQILLAAPNRLVCREECAGLCPKCGADLNEARCDCEQNEIDPRWAALADLKKEPES